jgi:hypothetical protein
LLWNFFLLSPATFFRLPAKGSKFAVAAVHATLFAFIFYFGYKYVSPSIMEGGPKAPAAPKAPAPAPGPCKNSGAPSPIGTKITKKEDITDNKGKKTGSRDVSYTCSKTPGDKCSSPNTACWYPDGQSNFMSGWDQDRKWKSEYKQQYYYDLK